MRKIILALAYVLWASTFSHLGNAAALLQSKVHFFNVGEGNFSLIQIPRPIGGMYNLIVDCGEKRFIGSDIMKPIWHNIDKRLNEELGFNPGDSKISVDLIISHADVDHYALLISDHLKDYFGDSIRIHKVLLGGKTANWTGGRTSGEFLEWIKKKVPAPELHIAQDEKIHGHLPSPYLFADPHIQSYLGPVTDDKNSQSVMVHLNYAGVSMLLPGDATGETMREARSEGFVGPIDVFLAAHHGADTDDSNATAWFEFLQPKIMILSVGPNNHPTVAKDGHAATKGHPTIAVFERAVPYCLSAPGAATHPIGLEFESGEKDPITNKTIYTAQERSISDAIYSTSHQGDITLRWSGGRRIMANAQRLAGPGHIFMLDGGDPGVAGGLGHVVFQPRAVAGAAAAAGP